jgi:hypothetical protein
VTLEHVSESVQRFRDKDMRNQKTSTLPDSRNVLADRPYMPFAAGLTLHYS